MINQEQNLCNAADFEPVECYVAPNAEIREDVQVEDMMAHEMAIIEQQEIQVKQPFPIMQVLLG